MGEPGRLTERQRDCLDVMIESIRRSGHIPTWRRMAEAMGCTSPTAMWFHMESLVRKGYVRWDRTKRRDSVQVLRDPTGRRIRGWTPEYEDEP